VVDPTTPLHSLFLSEYRTAAETELVHPDVSQSIQDAVPPSRRAFQPRPPGKRPTFELILEEIEPLDDFPDFLLLFFGARIYLFPAT
jgi:hypothetical protein